MSIFEKVKAESLISVAQMLGYEFHTGTNNKCPFCEKSGFSVQEKIFKCFKADCDLSGGAVELISFSKGIDPKQQKRELAEACNELLGFENNYHCSGSSKIEPESEEVTNKRNEAKSLWDESQAIPTDVWNGFCKSRGLEPLPLPLNIKYHLVRKMLVQKIVSNRGSFSGIHRYYLNESFGNLKKNGKSHKIGLGSAPQGEDKSLVLVYKSNSPTSCIVTEGLEEAMTLANCFPDSNIYTALNAGHMAEGIFTQNTHKEVYIFADADNAGRIAGKKLAGKLIEQAKLVSIILPPKGKDWNECFKVKGKQAIIESCAEADWQYLQPTGYKLRPGSGVFLTSKDKNGNNSLKPTGISNPIWVSCFIVDVESGHQYCKLGFEDSLGDIKTMIVSRSALASAPISSPEYKELIASGAPIHRGNINSFMGLLSSYKVKDVKGLKVKKGFGRFGWYGDSFILKNCINGNLEQLKLKSDTKHFASNGSYEEWSNVLIGLIARDDSKALFAISFALSSLITSRIDEYFEFLPALYVYCGSGKGKTTLQELIASTYGKPGIMARKDGVMLSFNGTANAMQARLKEFGCLPCMIDEKSLEGEVQGRSLSLNNFLYTLNAGDKDRMNADGSLKQASNQIQTECSLVFSGEVKEELTGNTGKQYRLTQLEWEGFKGDIDGSIADGIRQTVKKHYGHFLPVLVNEIIKQGDLTETYRRYKSKATVILTEAGIERKSIKRLTPNLARTILMQSLIFKALDIKATESFGEATIKACIHIYGENCIMTEDERVPEKLAEGLVTHSNKFGELKEGSARAEWPVSGEIWGKISPSRIYLIPRHLEAICANEFSKEQIITVLKGIGFECKPMRLSSQVVKVWEGKLNN